ncbi:hypothetical protein FRC08_003384 [Ceratobasidium sp. 394]|nr:hypothetical protein FRC08_003384 [Ceratobasidium sp. 394]KAG9087847.1 hypothetical protein FS749_002605 [Ceratobasidium sp. UAMH 11750]
MPSNITIDDYSPLIQYNGQWLDSFNLSLTIDPQARRYQGNSFHSSETNETTATLTFKGIAVYIFGAKRINHGYYHVSVDGEPGQQYDGYSSPDGLFQVPLFVREGLADRQHTVTLTNIVNGPQRPFVDIDYITWTRKQDVKIFEDGQFGYSAPTSVWTAQNNVDGYSSKTAHSTTTYGAAASLTFQGSEVFLYGGTGPNHGQFKVQLDDQQPLELNGTAPMQHPKTELYTASGLAAGSHQLIITNLDDGKVLDIDYAEVVPSRSKPRLSKGAIAGMVVGIVIGLALITLAIWFFFIYRRRRRHRRLSTDLMASDDSQTAMRTYSGRHNPAVVEPFVDGTNGQSAPAAGASQAQTGQGRGQGRDRKGVPAGTVNRATNQEAGLRPETVATETIEPSSSGRSGTGTAVETDAGALPPMYDQIERSKVAELPVRI